MNSNTKVSTLIVTGMHRSGTSLTASLLQSAGLDIGKNLMKPGYGNPTGFFENVDFVNFHQKVLLSQGVNEVGLIQQKIAVQEYAEEAENLVAENAQHPVWGWKDPRTTLFLEFWHSILPDANFLFVYRSPWEVADSLYRRGDRTVVEQPERAVQVWMYYNQNILRFYDRFAEQCLIASIYSVAGRTEALIEAINAKFHLNLTTPQEKYERSLLKVQHTSDHRSTEVSKTFPEAIAIYQALHRREVLINVDIN